MSMTRAAGVILAKELRTEFRSRELLGTTLVSVSYTHLTLPTKRIV